MTCNLSILRRQFSNFYLLSLLVFLGLLVLLSVGAAQTAQAAPDFAVGKDITLDTYTPQTGQTVTITTQIANLGPDAGSVNVTFYAGSELVDEQQVDDLAADTSVELTASWAIAADADTGAREIRVELTSAEDSSAANNQGRLSTVVYRAFSESEGDLNLGSGDDDSYSTLLHDGHLQIAGSGKLTITAGEEGPFKIDQEYPNQYFILVKGNGVLTLKDGAILRAAKPLTVYLLDDAQLIIKNGSLMQVGRIVARDTSRISIEEGTLEANLDLSLSELSLTNATLSGSSALLTTSDSDFKNSKLTYEILELEVDDPLTISASTFAIEDRLVLKSHTSSKILDSSFTLALNHFDQGFHNLTNVVTPDVQVSGTAEVQRWWYLTVRVIDLGSKPVANTKITYEPTLSGPGSSGVKTTNSEGEIIVPVLANITKAQRNNFLGNYEVTASYNGLDLKRSLTLHGNTQVVLQLEKRIDPTYSLLLQLRDKKTGGSLGGNDVEGGGGFIARVTLTYKDATNDPVVNQEVTITISPGGQVETSTTDEKGMVDIPLKAPEEAGTYTVEASAVGLPVTVTKPLTVAEDSGTLGNRDLAIIVVSIVVILGLLLMAFQRFTLSYPTDLALCGGCGQRIPLDSEVCPECGEKLDPYEAFDPHEESMVARDEGV